MAGGVGGRPGQPAPVEYLQRKERRGSYIAVAVILAVFLLANAGLYMGLGNAGNHGTATSSAERGGHPERGGFAGGDSAGWRRGARRGNAAGG